MNIQLCRFMKFHFCWLICRCTVKFCASTNVYRISTAKLRFKHQINMRRLKNKRSSGCRGYLYAATQRIIWRILLIGTLQYMYVDLYIKKKMLFLLVNISIRNIQWVQTTPNYTYFLHETNNKWVSEILKIKLT